MSQSNLEQEVLFQKLGTAWYVFAEIDGELVYSALPSGVDPHHTKLELYTVIEGHLKKMANKKKQNSKLTQNNE